MTAQRHIRNLALIGFMGTGKSSAGQLVAAQLHFDFLDTDLLIERRAGRTIAEIFAGEGEGVFREFERTAVEELSQCDRTVFATGGGLGADPGNLSSLKQHAWVVCLWASPACVYERVKQQNHRPLLQTAEPAERIGQLLQERSLIYRQADALVGTEGRTIREVAQQVIKQFDPARFAHPR